MQHYQVFTASIAIIFFIIVFTLIRRDSILMGAAFRWFAIAIGTLILGVYPQLSDLAAGVLGISYPPILPVTIACLVLMVKVLLADIERAKTQVKLDRLAQRLAMLELEVKSSTK
ncbi:MULTISPECIES: DUF2304 domain-containing protein [unclassified Pseudoalteromonas]|uniref:DUF2304 domain-containing protein n=1 Tax=unclassified Pseudoalteromonas TaxID=194690 RepID=UPI0005A8CDCF|nr:MULTISPECIES: DUF2304 domain-containing protein [unclassified Pseudoalteromonas]